MSDLTEQQAKKLMFAKAVPDTKEYEENEIIPRSFLSDPGTVTIESICSIDNRTKVTATSVMPYKAICKLYMKSPSGKNFVGTGWLTHQNKLYTAGHCVYDHKVGAWMSSIIVVPGKAGFTEPYGRYQAIELCTTRGWIQNTSERYDMGAIKLGSNVSHNDVFHPVLSDPSMGEVCGYPADRETGIFQFKMSDTLTKKGGQFEYLLDTYGGQSGAPLLKDRITAVGIHNYGGCPNKASDLYEEFIGAINKW
jgi:glutamyl endopeptidase